MFVGYIVSDIEQAKQLKNELLKLLPDKDPNIYILFNGWDEEDIKYKLGILTEPELNELNHRWIKFEGDSISEFIESIEYDK